MVLYCRSISVEENLAISGTRILKHQFYRMKDLTATIVNALCANAHNCCSCIGSSVCKRSSKTSMHA